MDSDLRAGLSDSTDNMCYVAGLRHECACVIPQANASCIFLTGFQIMASTLCDRGMHVLKSQLF